jgi:hypothetical protein
MACSFVLTGEFAPSRSVIRILDQSKGQGYVVTLIKPPGKATLPCPDCLNNATPLCVQYCEKSADLKELIQQGAADEA